MTQAIRAWYSFYLVIAVNIVKGCWVVLTPVSWEDTSTHVIGLDWVVCELGLRLGAIPVLGFGMVGGRP